MTVDDCKKGMEQNQGFTKFVNTYVEYINAGRSKLDAEVAASAANGENFIGDDSM